MSIKNTKRWGLVTTTVLNTKNSEVENKIPVISALVKRTDYDDKISEIGGKYITASDYNKFASDILDANIKQKELVNKSGISNIVKIFDSNTKLASLSTKAKLKKEEDKIVKLQRHDLIFFLGKNVFADDSSQNMFIYQPTLDKLELKKTKVLLVFLVGNERGYTLLKLNFCILLLA